MVCSDEAKIQIRLVNICRILPLALLDYQQYVFDLYHNLEKNTVRATMEKYVAYVGETHWENTGEITVLMWILHTRILIFQAARHHRRHTDVFEYYSVTGLCFQLIYSPDDTEGLLFGYE